MTTPIRRHVEDPYPSRTGARTQWIPRSEPVLHDARQLDTPGPLDAGQLAHFRDHGFVEIPDVLEPSEVESLRSHLGDLLESAAADSDNWACVREADSDEVRSVFDVHKSSVPFKRLSEDPRITDVARQILADDLVIHQSRVNCKPAFRGAGFSWHSDFETWHSEDGMPRMRALSASIALSDNLTCNGSLMLIPGSHRTFIGCAGETPYDNYRSSLQDQRIGVPDEDDIRRLVRSPNDVVMPTGPSGGVLFFDCNILHASAENISPFERLNAFFVFNAHTNALQSPFGGTEPRPSFLADRSPRVVRRSD